MSLKGRKVHGFGVTVPIDVRPFSHGDGEAQGAWGFYTASPRGITIEAGHQDDQTLTHEMGHFIADHTGVYLTEHQMVVFEAFFAILRDPRNRWLRSYFFGPGKQ